MPDVELFAVNRELEENLSAQVFGGEAQAQGIIARIADSPIGLNLRSIFATAKLEIPPSIDIYRRFDIWLVPIGVGIMRKSGLAEVTSVGCEVEFDDTGRTLCVIELLPGSAFITHGTVNGNFLCEGKLNASGAVNQLGANATSGPTTAVDLPQAGNFGLGLSVSAHAAAYVNFSFVVATPYVHAVGIGAKRVEWRLDQHKEPLFGRDLQFWAVVVRPKKEERLALRVRVTLTARTAFFPTRSESEWVSLLCQLER